jgi:uncharacterized protein YdeI (YjbR/CyaY-like superfamily)
LPTQPKRFRAVLQKDDHNLGWTIALLPFDPHSAWKDMLRLRVRGEVNGVAFRSSLFPHRDGGFYLLINRALQAGAGVQLGGSADFRLQPDLEPRPAELPDELAVLLDEEPGLRAWYDELSEYMRREIGKWICGVKSEQSRLRRAEQMAERLLATMEGEQELPPAIQAAFRAHPKAKVGWLKMTPTQRRNNLMAVFYYQTPEARQRRIDKLCEEAEKHAAARPTA